MSTARQQIVDYMRAQLMGPVGGAYEELRDPPDQRYTAAVLYPTEAGQTETTADDLDDDTRGAGAEGAADDPVALAGQWMPSSAGLSFFVESSQTIECRLTAAAYEQSRVERHTIWRRNPIRNSEVETCQLTWSGAGAITPVPVLEGRGTLHLTARPIGSGYVVTVSLVNARTHAAGGRPKPEDCIYQVELECRAVGGRIADYPRLEFLTADQEEEELFLAYRRHHVFAIGHGCAAGWDADGSTAIAVRADFIPQVEVAGIGPALAPDRFALSLNVLADESSDRGAVLADLTALIDEYASWIGKLDDDPVPPSLHVAKLRIIGRLRAAVGRMRAGLNLLSSDEPVQEAFQLANLAMLMQMHHSQVVASERRRRDTSASEPIEYLSLTQYRWYPFQIAFLLLCLPSLADEDSMERDIVDLLWFPTGGGKTEAYLLAAALVVFLRRLRRGDEGAGTTVITRYTLRLLTTQQFQRASALACAAEVLRKRDARLGTVPISIGLWVGGDASPNTYKDACEVVERILDGSDEDLLPIASCPWCGTELLPATRDQDRGAYGVEATNGSFKLYCPSRACAFHDSLPILIVDDQMYSQPPTILIGTVDKFARLAWTTGGGAFFGAGGRDSPSLIIQDELHLISGPLGTVVGAYEAAVEGLVELAGARAKVIASTATIRRAQDQARAVFGRDIALFPPMGLDASDSFFAQVSAERTPRLYVGVMSPNHTPATALVHVSAVLAQAPVELSLQGRDRNAYWTQVIYHNALRELGKSVTYARDDIPARIQVIAPVEDRRRTLRDSDVVELTANVPSRQIPGILSRMAIPHDSDDAISLLLATSMIQVGIDVPRLGLMLVSGQPKTTSEYIQASSRVGRGSMPGLVVTLLSSNKPRDRSHYESFRPYHMALYRHVEPTSVTPFSIAARNRVLHAALVILVRHAAGLPENSDAVEFRGDHPLVRRCIEVLLSRVAVADPTERRATEVHLERLVSEWSDRAEAARRDGSRLYYYTAGREHRRLLRQFGQSGEGWETLNSMRSVDRAAMLEVIGASAGG